MTSLAAATDAESHQQSEPAHPSQGRGRSGQSAQRAAAAFEEGVKRRSRGGCRGRGGNRALFRHVAVGIAARNRSAGHFAAGAAGSWSCATRGTAEVGIGIADLVDDHAGPGWIVRKQLATTTDVISAKISVFAQFIGELTAGRIRWAGESDELDPCRR